MRQFIDSASLISTWTSWLACRYNISLNLEARTTFKGILSRRTLTLCVHFPTFGPYRGCMHIAAVVEAAAAAVVVVVVAVAVDSIAVP